MGIQDQEEGGEGIRGEEMCMQIQIKNVAYTIHRERFSWIFMKILSDVHKLRSIDNSAMIDRQGDLSFSPIGWAGGNI